MRCVHHTAFWLAMFASSLFGFATFIPLWLGRISGRTTRFYALWYQLDCSESSCTGYEKMFDNDNVEGTYDFEVILLPACALLASIASFIGVLLIEIVSCDCGRRIDCNTKPVIAFSTILFWIASVFSVLGFFVSIAICFEFYKNDEIEHAAEFPWCTLMFGVGAILMVIATVLYTLILCKWEDHGMFYSPGGSYLAMLDPAESITSAGTYNKTYRESAKFVPSPSSYSDSIKRSFRDSSSSKMPIRESTKGPGHGGMSSFMDAGSMRTSSDYSVKNKDSTYFDFRLGSSKKASFFSSKKVPSSENLKKPTIHDSPSILRHTTAKSFIREERDSIRESRKIPKVRSMEEIDPKRLSTGYTHFRDTRLGRLTDDARDSDYMSHSSRSSGSGNERRAHSDYAAYDRARRDKNDSPGIDREIRDDSDSPRSDRGRQDSNVLDVLYRESRKYRD